MTNPASSSVTTTPVTEAVTPSSPDRPPTIWPTIPYPDPQAAIDFLVSVFGFEPTRQPDLHGHGPVVGQMDLRRLPRQLT